MTDIIETSAEMVDDAIVRVDFTPAAISFDYDGVRARVNHMIEPYQGLSEEQWLEIDMKECKSSRAHLNRIVKEIKSSRKIIEREYNRPLADFIAFCKEIESAVNECSSSVDAAIKLRESREKESKRQTLEDHYYEFCFDNGNNALPVAVPFDRILVSQWLNKSYSIAKAKDEIEARVAEILSMKKTVESTLDKLDERYAGYREEAFRVFWQRLSITAVNEYIDNAVELQKKIDEAEAESAAVMEYREPEPVMVAPEPEPVPLDVYEQPQTAEVEPVFTWEITVDCTRTQLRQIRDVMEAMGLEPHGRRVVM